MKSIVIRTAIVTSLVTALAVSGLSYYAIPKLRSDAPVALDQPYNGVSMQPAVYNGPSPYGYNSRQTVSRQSSPQLSQRTPLARRSSSTVARDQYGEPIVRRKRSTEKSVLIVAASSGTGAAVGALAGGKKGAGIGALAGGVGGFIYDRMTANPK